MSFTTTKKVSRSSGKYKSRQATVEDSSDDEDYVLPKNPCKEPNLPTHVFNGDGKEDEEFMEAGAKLVQSSLSPDNHTLINSLMQSEKRKAKKAKLAAEAKVAEAKTWKKSTSAKSKPKPKPKV
jgi:hypothetical protein